MLSLNFSTFWFRKLGFCCWHQDNQTRYVILRTPEGKSEKKVSSEWKIYPLSSQEGQNFHFYTGKTESVIGCNAFLGKVLVFIGSILKSLENIIYIYILPALIEWWHTHKAHCRPPSELPRLGAPREWFRETPRLAVTASVVLQWFLNALG